MRTSYNSRLYLPFTTKGSGIAATSDSHRIFKGRGVVFPRRDSLRNLRDHLGKRAFEKPEGLTTEEETAIEDLLAIVSADYNAAVSLLSAEKARSIAGIVWLRGEFLKGLRIEKEGTKPACGDLVIRSEPYTQGAGLHLWGFLCDLRQKPADKFLIYVNTAHRRGAVTSTLAHEFGHYILHKFEGPPPFENQEPLNGLSGHLQNPEELLCDSVASLLAIPKHSLRHSGDIVGYIEDGRRDLADALDAIRPEYRMYVKSEKTPFEWHVRYLAATLHLFKLRRALAETWGI